ncbi:hypothetical protein [Proteus vulgaris]|uniref:hypothetical protein n=1 Tax=Proteus vulgaris TaxID=585 RepID=UPI000C9FF1E9|nr:hypothetical protein [Proteus vulgaris]UBH62606.1 hypothetical protein LA322_03315 [Proteus vulgaris]VTP83123.1 Uncharacterised protein [Proteus vulgaris]
MNVNGLKSFDARISFSTSRVVFDNDKLTITKNIKNISNTTTKFNFVKKVFNAMRKFSTLLMMSQSGRMGIENRKGNIVRYTDEMNILNSRFNECFELQNENSKELKNKGNELDSLIINRENLKLTLLNNDIFNEFIHNEKELELILNDPEKLKELINNNESFKSKIDNDEKIGKIIKNFLKSNRIELEKNLESAIDLKNKLIIEERKVDHFLSLIENENVSFNDRYSFFNYLNELKRAESFCQQSGNPSDEQLADVFKNIFEERISRVKESDVKKIYSEVIDTYHYETFFLKENKSILANFSSNNEKEKFLSKINFLVSISESHPDILNNLFDQNISDKLHDIMHTILNEEYHDSGVNISYFNTKNTWIKEYMNEFYGSERKITTQSVGTNTENEKITQSVGTNTENEKITQSVGKNTENENEKITQSEGTNTDIQDVDSYNNNAVYSNEKSHDGEVFFEIEGLDSILKEFSTELKNRDISNYSQFNDAIKNMLDKLSVLSDVITETLESPIVEEKKLLVSVENMEIFSKTIYSIQQQLVSIKPDYASGLGNINNFYPEIQRSTEDISDAFENIINIITPSRGSDSTKSEIKTLLSRVFNKINTSKIVLRKEMLNVAIELFDKLVKESESKLTDDFSEVKGKKNTVLTNNKIK